MLEPPASVTIEEHRSRLGDVGYWWPYVAEVLGRHGLADADREPVAGYNPTFPTFLVGDVVVKLFGNVPSWRQSHEAERAAYELLATDPEILAPRLLGRGRLSDDPDASWPYLAVTRIPGVALEDAELSPEQRRTIAEELGRLIRRVHELEPSGIATDEDWPDLDVATAAERSSLPPHLVAQVDDYLGRLGPFDRVFVHGDLVAMHAFVEEGHLTGVIDWADAIVTDRHYELAQVFRDTFDCDGTLLRTFLDASDWPVGPDFARRTLGHALRRQGMMLVQHTGGDVFEPIAEKFPLDDIATLDELATELFGS
jgi:aminoglycoside phosphotransferase